MAQEELSIFHRLLARIATGKKRGTDRGNFELSQHSQIWGELYSLTRDYGNCWVLMVFPKFVITGFTGLSQGQDQSDLAIHCPTLTLAHSASCCSMMFFWATCIAQSVDSWLSLRLVINRTALNPEWIRGRLLVQHDELWSNRRRMSCGEILQWAATAWIRMSMFALWICLYDLVCKFFLCFHDCSLLSWRFRAQPCGWNSLIHHERDGKVAAMSSFVIIRSMVKLRHSTDLKSVVGDPKRIQKGVISVQFQPSVISAQREGLRCWLWQCFSCS